MCIGGVKCQWKATQQQYAARNSIAGVRTRTQSTGGWYASYNIALLPCCCCMSCLGLQNA